MGFDDAVDGALDILRRRGRVSYDALKRQFDLDDDGIAALRHELVDVLGAANDERGELLTIRTAPAEPKAERRQLTVLAADLVGSTALSMRLDPEDLRELMQVYQATCTRTIERLGGHVATWQGDGVFVLFGYPRAGEDDAIRAVTCAWEIVNDLGPARERFKRQHGISLAVRIGVHTGAAVVGDEGTTSAWQTHAFGGTPNIAARVAASAVPDTVAVTESTRRLTAGYFLYEPIGIQKLKGVSQPQELHRVTGPGKVRDRFTVSLVRGLTPLVGRDRERAHLAEAAERARAGLMAAVLITGDPGIGKSRLVHYVRQEAVRLQQLHCQCSPYHRGTALHPVLEALRRRWGLEGDAESQLAALRSARPDDTPRDIALLAALLDLPVPPGSPPLGSPQRQRADTLDVLVALLRAEARKSPLVLVVEDVHWIDPSTIELLGALLASGRDVPLLLLLTARPEFAPPWGPAAGLELLVLDRLSPEHARELIGHVAPAATTEDIDRLAAGTDGVPLFAEEMTRAVLESDEGDIPTTLYGCLMARLDRDRATLTVAQVAAAIGREFGRDLLGLVCDLEPDQIDACLGELVRRSAARRRRRPRPAVRVPARADPGDRPDVAAAQHAPGVPRAHRRRDARALPARRRGAAGARRAAPGERRPCGRVGGAVDAGGAARGAALLQRRGDPAPRARARAARHAARRRRPRARRAPAARPRRRAADAHARLDGTGRRGPLPAARASCAPASATRRSCSRRSTACSRT